MSKGMGGAWLMCAALAITACTGGSGDDEATAASEQALGSGGSGGSGEPCAPQPPAQPPNPSCQTANKVLFNVTWTAANGTASGDYPIGLGQENQPPPAAYRADVCQRAWLDCVNGHVLPQEAAYCRDVCGGACAVPSGPANFGHRGNTAYTVVPCGSGMCWHITCPAYGCAANVGCCATVN